MLKQERPSTTSQLSGRQTDTFSRQHRERLAMGGGTGAAKKLGRSNARITVVVRKRPLCAAESQRGEVDILDASDASRTRMKVDEPRKNMCGVVYKEEHEFTFDRAYSEKQSNRDVYDSCVRQLVDAVFTQGAKCSCFTYGQTGSGKTYTMVGPGRLGAQVNRTDTNSQGLLELAARDCFAWLRQPEFDYHFGLYVGFFEIYCNKVYDLLGERRLVRALETKTSDGVVVKDLTTVKVDSIEPLLKTIGEGLELRVVGTNSKNSDSSRGHAVLTLEIRNEHTQTSFGKLAFIDLAGSERGADAMYSGKQTQTDGAGINRSLLALKECIRALDQQSSHVPFRDSELTKVLRDMFIGTKAKTLMIACVSPSSACCEQTLNTLRYADRVKAIRRNCQPDVDGNEVANTIVDTDDEGKNTARQTRASHRRSRSPDQRRARNEDAVRHQSASDGSESESETKSDTLSLGTSHDSDDATRPGRQPVSSRGEEKKSRKQKIGEEDDFLSPRVSSRANTVSRLPRQQASTRTTNVSPSFRESLRPTEASRLSASCFDPHTGGDLDIPAMRSVFDMPARGSVESSYRRVPNATVHGTSLPRKDIPLSQQLEPVSRVGGTLQSRTTRASVINKDWTAASQGSLTMASQNRLPSAARHLRSSEFEKPQLPSHLIDTTRIHSGQNQGKNEISKIFPKPDADDSIAAANLLRKRFRDFEFPILPKVQGEGKHVDVGAAAEMLETLAEMPAGQIHQFYEKYSGKMQSFYNDVVRSHLESLKAITCSGITQQKMIRDVESNRTSEGFEIDENYLANLRSKVEHQLLLQLRLAKRVAEMERMLALQRTLIKKFQIASAHDVEFYSLDLTEKNEGLMSNLSHAASSRIISRSALPPSSPHSRLSGRESFESVMVSSRSNAPASLRPIKEYSLVGSQSSTPRDSKEARPSSSDPLQPPTALSLETQHQRRRAEFDAEGFAIPQDLPSRPTSSSTSTTVRRLRRATRRDEGETRDVREAQSTRSRKTASRV